MQQAGCARRTESAVRAVGFVRHCKAFPRYDVLRRRTGDQRPRTLGQLRMCRKERLDATRAGGTQSRHGSPPAPSARNTHCEIGQRADATNLTPYLDQFNAWLTEDERQPKRQRRGTTNFSKPSCLQSSNKPRPRMILIIILVYVKFGSPY
jgi:ribosomal protein L44E